MSPVRSSSAGALAPTHNRDREVAGEQIYMGSTNQISKSYQLQQAPKAAILEYARSLEIMFIIITYNSFSKKKNHSLPQLDNLYLPFAVTRPIQVTQQ